MKRQFKLLSPLSLLIFALLIATPAYSVDLNSLISGEKKEDQQVPERDPFLRENPRDTFSGFVKAIGTSDYLKAAQYLRPEDRKPPEQMKELLTQFRYLLDHGYFGSMEAISSQPSGSLSDGLDPNTESLGKIAIEGHTLDLTLTRIKTKDGADLWFVSRESLRGVPSLYAKVEHAKIFSKLPPWLIENRIWNAPLYVWFSAILFLPVFLGIAWLLIHAIILLVRLVKKLFHHPLKPHPFKMARPVVIILAAIFHFMFMSAMGLPILLRQYYGKLISVMIWLGIAWFILYLIETITGRYTRHLERQGRLHTQSLMILFQKFLKVVALIVISIIILKTVGFKVTTALAGLGIGGIAIALSAQKTIENLFGGVSLLSDQVMRVGDFCKIGDRVGTIEDIGLRSTRVRTLDRTVLYVPNGVLSVETLENYSRRDKFWFHHDLTLRYETTSEQIRKIVDGIQKLFKDHEKVESVSARARFIRLADYSLDIDLFAYLYVNTIEEHLQISEELLLKCMEIVTAAGAGFAFPSQTTYIAQDSLTTS